MSRLLILAIATMLAVIPCAASSAPLDSYLVNGGFEQGSGATVPGWSLSFWPHPGAVGAASKIPAGDIRSMDLHCGIRPDTVRAAPGQESGAGPVAPRRRDFRPVQGTIERLL